MSKPIEDEIRNFYQSHDGEWLVPNATISEARMMKRAVERIDDLNQRIEEAEALAQDWSESFDNELDEERTKNAELFDFMIKEGGMIRNAAQSFVTQFDKAWKKVVDKDGD